MNIPRWLAGRFLLSLALAVGGAGLARGQEEPPAAPLPEQVDDEPESPRTALFRPLSQVKIRLKATGDRLPEDDSDQLFAQECVSPGGSARPWARTRVCWSAPEIWHRPLYFDDQVAERYGQSPCPLFQPGLSAAHFFGTFAILPYKMGVDGVNDCISTLGMYRPGSPTPCVGRRLPWEPRGALYEAGAITGLFFLLP